MKHGAAFRRIDEVGIGLGQRTFEHIHSISWSVPDVSSEVCALMVRNKDLSNFFCSACAEVEEGMPPMKREAREDGRRGKTEGGRREGGTVKSKE